MIIATRSIVAPGVVVTTFFVMMSATLSLSMSAWSSQTSSEVARDGRAPLRSRSETMPTSLPAETTGRRRIRFSRISRRALPSDSFLSTVITFGVIHFETNIASPSQIPRYACRTCSSARSSAPFP